MDIIFVPFLHIVLVILNLYTWVLIVSVIMSWLEAFQIINRYNKFVYTVQTILFRLTDPLLTPIRRMLPSLGGVDLSALVLLLIIQFLSGALGRVLMRFAF